MTHAPIRLNPDLDIAAAAAAYRRDGWVQIADIFTPETAAFLADVVETRIDWDLAFQGEDGRPAVLGREEIVRQGEAAMQQRLRQMMTQAGSAYGFLQGAWPFGLVELAWTAVAFNKWLKLRKADLQHRI